MGNSSSALVETVGEVIECVISPVVSWLVGIFAKKPEDSNYTLRQIQENHERAREEQDRRYDEPEARAEARAHEAHEREAAFREREEAARSAVDEASTQEAAAEMREEDALAKANEANNALLHGIRPVVLPSESQVQDAMERIPYNSEKLHFAVCGTSGSGKSSLINAFRGLKPHDEGAAAVRVTETTSKVTCYPDSRNKPPYTRFVWYDIPGAGTTAVSDWQYFNDQGLFVFDFIVMVYDVRFTKIDVGIIENCYRFNIPIFTVRSKADQHIDNMIKEEEIDADDDYEEIYQKIKTKYMEATRSDFDKHMEAMAESPEVDDRDRQMTLSQRVYILSGANVRGLLQSGARKGNETVLQGKLIDEDLLVEDMLRAAARRPYSKPETKGLFRKGRETISAGFASAV